MSMTNRAVLLILFESLRGLTPWDILHAYRAYLQRRIDHDQAMQDTNNVVRWRNLLAVLPHPPEGL